MTDTVTAVDLAAVASRYDRNCHPAKSCFHSVGSSLMTLVAQPIGDLASRGRLFWLPRLGTGNGLGADGWAPILTDLDPRIVADLLDILAAASVPAFASTGPPPGNDPTGGVRLWVDSTRYSQAEDVLMNWLRSPAAHRTPPHDAHRLERGGRP